MGRTSGPLIPVRWAHVRWYIGSLMGDTHYQRYLAHRRRAHPGEPVLSVSQYWRMRHRQADIGPNPRCC